MRFYVGAIDFDHGGSYKSATDSLLQSLANGKQSHDDVERGTVVHVSPSQVNRSVVSTRVSLYLASTSMDI